MSDPQRILILSIKAGAGHFRAAQALEQSFREQCPDATVRHEDALEFTNAAFRKSFSEGYEALVRDLPSVWGMIYESFEEQPSRSPMKKLAGLFDRLNAAPLRQMVRRFDPDRIVCTHYVPAEVLGARRCKQRLRAPISVVLTDYDIHTMWIQDGVNHYFVATDEMAYALHAKGIAGAQVHVTGIPILPAFSRTYPDRSAMRAQLGLRPESLTVLMAAGGFGLMRVDEAVSLLAERIPSVQLLAVAGRNKKLEERLREAAARAPGKIVCYGFVDNMHELMAASDLAVAKSGGLTTSECLAMGLPMVVFKPIPGQEERNATFLLEHGAGVWAHTAAHMIFKVEQLLKDPARLAHMRAAARRIAKPDAAHRIAEIVVKSGV